MDTTAHGPHGGAPAAHGARPGGPRRRRPTTAAERAASRVAIADRRQKVTALVLQKVPLADIARKLGTSKPTVTRDVQWVRDQWIAEARDNVGQVVLRELASLDSDEARLRAKMLVAGSEDLALKYYQTILRLMERRARLLGLDAPERIIHSGTITEERIDVRAILLDPASAALAADLVRRANEQTDPRALSMPRAIPSHARARSAENEEEAVV